MSDVSAVPIGADGGSQPAAAAAISSVSDTLTVSSAPADDIASFSNHDATSAAAPQPDVEATHPATLPAASSPSSAAPPSASASSSCASPSSSSSGALSAEVAKRVLKQMEFYFSNSNLPKDSFLRGLYDADPQHWVELSVIAQFNRMRELLGDSEEALAALPDILAASSSLRLSPDRLKVTRVEPLPETVDNSASTVLASGFPLSSLSIDSVSAFFVTVSGGDERSVLSVRLRRNEEKQYDGSAWVEFSSREAAEKVAAQGKLTFEQVLKEKQEGEQEAEVKERSSSEISLMMRAAFFKKQREEQRAAGGGAADAVMKTGRGQKRKSASTDGADKAADTSTATEADGSAAAGEDGAEAVDPDADRSFTPGLLVRFDTVNTEQSSRESLRAFVEQLGARVAYVDYSKGEDSAVVRLHDESEVKAPEAVQKLQAGRAGKEAGDSKEGEAEQKAAAAGVKAEPPAEGGADEQRAAVVPYELDGKLVEVRAMEGEEEAVYWKAVWKQMRDRKEQRDSQGGGRGGKGGRGGSRGRGRDRGRGGKGGWRGKGGQVLRKRQRT